MSTDASVRRLAGRLDRLVADSGVVVSADVHATPERIHLSLSDRSVAVARHDGPDGADRWTVTLRADGETVSKFGRFEGDDAVVEQVRSLCDADVQYTVCCDG